VKVGSWLSGCREPEQSLVSWCGSWVCTGRHTPNARELHSPLQEGHKEVTQLLLEHGAKTEAAKEDGETPLFTAAKVCPPRGS